MNYMNYPDACGDPATVPSQGVVGIESDDDELLYIVSASFPVFYGFSHDFGSLLAPFRRLLVSFGTLLAPLGSFLMPLDPKLEQ